MHMEIENFLKRYFARSGERALILSFTLEMFLDICHTAEKS